MLLCRHLRVTVFLLMTSRRAIIHIMRTITYSCCNWQMAWRFCHRRSSRLQCVLMTLMKSLIIAMRRSAVFHRREEPAILWISNIVRILLHLTERSWDGYRAASSLGQGGASYHSAGSAGSVSNQAKEKHPHINLGKRWPVDSYLIVRGNFISQWVNDRRMNDSPKTKLKVWVGGWEKDLVKWSVRGRRGETYASRSLHTSLPSLSSTRLNVTSKTGSYIWNQSLHTCCTLSGPFISISRPPSLLVWKVWFGFAPDEILPFKLVIGAFSQQ